MACYLGFSRHGGMVGFKQITLCLKRNYSSENYVVLFYFFLLMSFKNKLSDKFPPARGQDIFNID